MRFSSTLIVKCAMMMGCFGVCLLAAIYSRATHSAGSFPWYSIIPPVLAVMLAVVTGRIRPSLAAAVISGGFLAAIADSNGFAVWLANALGRTWLFAIQTVWLPESGTFNTGNVRILLYVVLIMTMISVMLAAGGLQGVARRLEKYARSARSTQLATMALGLVIFIDDYANTMIVGATMRGVTDRQRISREKLAFIVDATAAPVAGIAVLSTWIGYEVGLLSGAARSLGVAKDGYEIFFDAIGFRFYCILMIAFVFLNAWSGQDFGPMARAQRRAEAKGRTPNERTPNGKTSSAIPDAFASAGSHPEGRASASVAVVPMLALLAVFLAGIWIGGSPDASPQRGPWAILHMSAWRGALGKADSILMLVYASLTGLLAAVALAKTVARVPIAAIVKAAVVGAKSSMLPVAILALAWALKGACDELQTGQYLAAVLGKSLRPWVFPALVFVVSGLTSFATGTSWGTMAILIPTAIPVAFSLDGNVYGTLTVVSVAAILDGAIFGDHCSPLSDTTIMSSTASSCDHLAHVATQTPYSLCVAAIALGVGYLPATLGVPGWCSVAIGVVLLASLFFYLKAVDR